MGWKDGSTIKVLTALAKDLSLVPSSDEDLPQSVTPCLLLASAGPRHECGTHIDKTPIYIKYSSKNLQYKKCTLLVFHCGSQSSVLCFGNTRRPRAVQTKPICRLDSVCRQLVLGSGCLHDTELKLLPGWLCPVVPVLQIVHLQPPRYQRCCLLGLNSFQMPKAA